MTRQQGTEDRSYLNAEYCSRGWRFTLNAVVEQRVEVYSECCSGAEGWRFTLNAVVEMRVEVYSECCSGAEGWSLALHTGRCGTVNPCDVNTVQRLF